MEVEFRPISLEDVKTINNWNYEGFAEEVAMNAYLKSYEQSGELLGPGGCHGYGAYSEGELVGLFEYTVAAGTMEIGLALRPDLIGKGMGEDFVRQGLEFGLHTYDEDMEMIRLQVDAENIPAIRIYENIGFLKMNQEGQDLTMQLLLGDF